MGGEGVSLFPGLASRNTPIDWSRRVLVQRSFLTHSYSVRERNVHKQVSVMIILRPYSRGLVAEPPFAIS